MSFRNLSSSETRTDQFEAACNFETSTCLLLLSWIDTTTRMQSLEGKRGVVHRTAFLCMEIHIGVLINVRFYYGEISNKQ